MLSHVIPGLVGGAGNLGKQHSGERDAGKKASPPRDGCECVRNGLGRMSHFLGTHLNRIDAKGRVSVPAPFRTGLRAVSDSPVSSLVLRPSHKYTCIEAWPVPVFEVLASSLDQLDVFSDEHDDLATALYADAYPVDSDREGRIVLPEPLTEHAGLQDAVMFMGTGRTFQMWEPATGKQHQAGVRERARERGLTLPGRAPGGSARGSVQ